MSAELRSNAPIPQPLRRGPRILHPSLNGLHRLTAFCMPLSIRVQTQSTALIVTPNTLQWGPRSLPHAKPKSDRRQPTDKAIKRMATTTSRRENEISQKRELLLSYRPLERPNTLRIFTLGNKTETPNHLQKCGNAIQQH